MAALVALYSMPEDVEAFDARYVGRHVPLANKVPGLVGNAISTGPVMAADGPSPYHRVAILSFASLDDLQAGLASPEGQAAAADSVELAGGRVTFLIFETAEMLAGG